MSSVVDNGKKWIQTSVALLCMLIVYILIEFFNYLGVVLDLESKITAYNAGSQVVSVLISLGTFVYIISNTKTRTYLDEVYQEAAKVVWPDKNETVRHTIGIMIGVTIIGCLLFVFDIGAQWILEAISDFVKKI